MHKTPTFARSRRGHGKHLYPQLLKIKRRKKKKGRRRRRRRKELLNINWNTSTKSTLIIIKSKSRKSVPYRTGWYGRYIPYWPMHRYRYTPYFVGEKIPAVLDAYRPYRQNPAVLAGKWIPAGTKSC